jgi:dephospho-CoA kinase
MKIICITGMPLAGKTLISSFAKELGIPVISMGDKIREIAKRNNINVKDIGNLIFEIRNKYGKDAIAKQCYEDIKKISSDVIIDGIRNIEEIEYFSKLGEVFIIAIFAPRKLRFERALKRKREDDPKNYEEFIQRDLRELNLGIGNVISLADYVIQNDKDVEKAKEAFLNILKEILEK